MAYCEKSGIGDPFKASINQGMNFLADMYAKGGKFSSLNVASSALSAIFPLVNGVSFGKNPDVQVIEGHF